NGDELGDAATVTYQLTAPALVTASVLDDLGDTVATLFSQRQLTGRQTFVWSGVALPDGRYRLSLLAKDDRGNQVQSKAAFEIDRTLGVFAADTPVFSPNGDGRLDEVTFSYRLYAQAHVRLDIFRGSTIVATPILDSYGNTLGLKEVSWGGRLPDGRYSAILSATDSVMTVEGSVPLRVDTKAPTLRLVSLRALRLWLSEPARVVFAVNGRWRRLEVKRAGFFSIGHRGKVRGLTAFALDAGANQSRTVSARR
nr:hypothetical protein [Actinomycetota bacterium]